MLAGWEQHVSEAEIRRLALHYADAFLTRDAELMLSLWARDSPPATPPDFDAAWAEALVRRWDTPTLSVLHVTNHLIWLDDATHAHGRVYCLAQLDQGEVFVDQSIIYEDTYFVSEGRWKFAVRRHVLWFGVKRNEHPLCQPAANWPSSQVGAGSLFSALGELRGSRR